MMIRKIFGLLACVGLTMAYAGAAAQFQYDGIRLGTWMPLTSFPGSPVSGAACYGYTSASGREYALMCLRNGNAVVEVTDPFNAHLVQHIPGPSSLWHEIVTLGNYAYAVTEAGGGVQIINLNNVDSGVVTLAATYTGGGISSGHTVESNPASNTVYVNGSNLGGLVALDCTNPTAPVQSGRWPVTYVHDSLIVTYTSGPYAGREICFACCGSAGFYTIDVTNKANMVTLGQVSYPNLGYCHSCSITADRHYALINDEFDESQGRVPSCTTTLIDISDLANPTFFRTYTNGVNAIDHNSNLRDGLLFLSAYTSGLRIYDVHDVNNIFERGWFDTRPEGNGFTYNGDWGVYAYFPSGTAIASDIERGLFVFDPSEAVGQGARLMSYALLRAGYISGTLNDVRKSDDSYFKVIDGPRISSTEPYQMSMSWTANTVTANPTMIDLSVEGKVVGSVGGTLVLELKNVNTGAFEQVGSQPITTSDTVISVNNIAAANYIDASNNIVLRTRVLVTTPIVGIHFQTWFDQVKIQPHR